MTGRTNAIGANTKLFAPTLSLSEDILTINDRNGDFCTKFKLSLGYDDDEVAYVEKTGSSTRVNLGSVFENSGTVLVRATGLLAVSGYAHVEYEVDY